MGIGRGRRRLRSPASCFANISAIRSRPRSLLVGDRLSSICLTCRRRTPIEHAAALRMALGEHLAQERTPRAAWRDMRARPRAESYAGMQADERGLHRVSRSGRRAPAAASARRNQTRSRAWRRERRAQRDVTDSPGVADHANRRSGLVDLMSLCWSTLVVPLPSRRPAATRSGSPGPRWSGHRRDREGER